MNSKPIIAVVAVLAIGMTIVMVQPPAWVWLLFGSMVLAALYIAARQNSRYDPLDPRFGSCIPPISKPKDE